MLTHRPVTTILPVSDLGRGRAFYGETLGLAPSGNLPAALLFEDGKIELEQREQPRPAEHTALSFEVEDVVNEVQQLERRGVVFEDYDMPGLRTEQHIAELDGSRAAWFRDPDGNILCIHQPMKS
jgi:catechol 2,3-dioxygenase-like lactoylglutathione lyase family enzyme